MEDNLTIDEAIKWLAKAQQLGFYNANVARLIKAGADAVRSVLADDEDKSVVRVERDLDAIHVRLLNKAGHINRETVQTYISRTKRLIKDYQGWLKDPKSYMPTARRARGPAKVKRAAAEEAFAEDLPAPASREVLAPEPGYRDHVLHLSTGKAVLRVPVSISAEDVTLLTLVIKSHGPAAVSTPTA